jgi:hypothetical protein
MLIHADDIDQALNWPAGTARRQALRKRLPHYVLPDGAIRFRLAEILALVQPRPPATSTCRNKQANATEAGKCRPAKA